VVRLVVTGGSLTRKLKKVPSLSPGRGIYQINEYLSLFSPKIGGERNDHSPIIDYFFIARSANAIFKFELQFWPYCCCQCWMSSWKCV